MIGRGSGASTNMQACEVMNMTADAGVARLVGFGPGFAKALAGH